VLAHRFAGATPTIENIQDVAEQVLIAADYLATARAYIVYREQHKRLREDRRTVVDVATLELREAEAETTARLESIAVEDLASGEDLLAREDAHVQSIERLSAELTGLVGKEPTEILGPNRDAAALEVEQKVDHALEKCFMVKSRNVARATARAKIAKPVKASVIVEVPRRAARAS